jgi:hypothetical protein
VLEPDRDPDFTSSVEERARGATLLAQCVAWLGGAEALDRAVLRWTKDEIVESNGAQHRSHDLTLLAPDGSTRRESAWNDFFSHDVLTPRDAFRLEAGGVRTLAPSQRRALERRLYRDVIGLLQARHRDDFVVASPGAGVLHIRCDGTTHELAVDPASGAIRAHACTGWSERLRYGALRRTFTQWTEAGGLRVPSAWEETCAGEAQAPTDRLAGGWRLEVLDAAPPQSFTRPAPPAAADR